MLTKLNSQLLLRVFDNLDLIDSINLAETCDHLREVAEKKYQQRYTTFNLMLYLERQANICNSWLTAKKILSHIGKYITVLIITIEKNNWIVKSIHMNNAIQKYCVNVKNLTVNFTIYHSKPLPPVDIILTEWIQNLKLESLTLSNMYPLYKKLFLGISTLKELILNNLDCEQMYDDLYDILEKNSNIESLVLPFAPKFNFKIFSKLRRLRHLDIDVSDCRDLRMLLTHLKTDKLKKFTLHVYDDYTSELLPFLKSLSKTSNIDEMSITTYQAFDERTFDALGLFSLTSLYLHDYYVNELPYENLSTIQPNLTSLNLMENPVVPALNDDITSVLIKNLTKLTLFHIHLRYEKLIQLVTYQKMNAILQTSFDRPTLHLHIGCMDKFIIVKIHFTESKYEVINIRREPSYLTSPISTLLCCL